MRQIGGNSLGENERETHKGGFRLWEYLNIQLVISWLVLSERIVAETCCC